MAKNVQFRSGTDKIKAAAEFIEVHFDRPINISDVACEVGLSAGHFMHLFKEHAGTTFIGYLTNLRIARAKKLLMTTDKKCSNLYLEVGYNSNAYFTRRFKEVVGLTPAQFRIRSKKTSRL
ncbi:MAG: helix-turn-helix transcriptional regulator [Planctomycetota bacterium]|jgi:two-component system response regulator YesN